LSKYRLKEVTVCVTTLNHNNEIVKTPGTKWVVEARGWFGWGGYGFEESLPYNEAKRKLENAIKRDEADEAYYEKLRVALKEPKKTLYPPLPDEEPK
jgi:hypothetical protein